MLFPFKVGSLVYASVPDRFLHGIGRGLLAVIRAIWHGLVVTVHSLAHTFPQHLDTAGQAGYLIGWLIVAWVIVGLLGGWFFRVPGPSLLGVLLVIALIVIIYGLSH